MITSVSAYVNLLQRQLLFTFPAFLNAGIYSSFRFPTKTDVCVVTDYISFPSSGRFSSKIRFLFQHYEPIKQWHWKSKTKILYDCTIETVSKVPRHLESKSSGAFNFIGIVALKLNLTALTSLWKLRSIWRHKPNVKDNEKRKHKKKAVWYKNQRNDFITKTSNSDFWCSVFNWILERYRTSTLLT